MDDDFEVIYLDDDERNATVRRATPSTSYSSSRPRPPSSAAGFVSAGTRKPAIIRHYGTSGQQYTADRHRPTQVVVHQPAPRRGLGGLSTGELIDVAAQILAAIQPLPGAPPAQGHVETDVENLVIYQTALATHAKRDEQLRTLGSLLGKLLK
jgi:hypothetical protein